MFGERRAELAGWFHAGFSGLTHFRITSRLVDLDDMFYASCSRLTVQNHQQAGRFLFVTKDEIRVRPTVFEIFVVLGCSI